MTRSSWPAWATDALLAVGVAAVLALVVALAGADSVLPFVFTTAIGALLLLRRRLPRSVLALTVLATCAYYTLDQPAMGVAVPVVVAVWAAAHAGHLVAAIVGSAAMLVLSTVFRLLDGVEAVGVLLGYESVSNLALFAAAIALGVAMRSRRVALAQQARIESLTRAQIERDADDRLRRERLRISRDLHDTVGHAMSAIALQASAGAEALAGDEPAAREALTRIREVSSRSLDDVRGTVRRLREGADDRPVSLAALDDVLALARSAGLAADLTLDVAVESLPPAIDAAAFRIVQEAVTNVVRHSGATRVQVAVSHEHDDLVVRVRDDGTGMAWDAEPGYGLAGMRERVRLLGGSLQVRSVERGVVVEALLPARLEP